MGTLSIVTQADVYLCFRSSFDVTGHQYGGGKSSHAIAKFRYLNKDPTSLDLTLTYFPSPSLEASMYITNDMLKYGNITWRFY